MYVCMHVCMYVYIYIYTYIYTPGAGRRFVVGRILQDGERGSLAEVEARDIILLCVCIYIYICDMRMFVYVCIYIYGVWAREGYVVRARNLQVHLKCRYTGCNGKLRLSEHLSAADGATACSDFTPSLGLLRVNRPRRSPGREHDVPARHPRLCLGNPPDCKVPKR